MKQTISSTWVMQLAIVFILIFASYLSITINYGKSYRLKNQVLSVIERKEGFSTNSESSAAHIINNYLANNSYSAKGNCEAGYYGAKSLNSYNENNYEFVYAPSQGKYYYCVKKVTGYNSYNSARSYYKVMLFAKFDLPILGDIIDFQAKGRTTELDLTYDSLFKLSLD